MKNHETLNLRKLANTLLPLVENPHISIPALAKLGGVVRQTVARHLEKAEEYFDKQLFVKNGTKLTLTDAGIKFVEETLSIKTGATVSSDLDVNYVNHEELIVYSKCRHSNFSCSVSKIPLISEIFECWMESKMKIESVAAARMLPFLLTFKKTLDGDWLCLQVGSQSSHCRWHGFEKGTSFVGKSSSEDGSGIAYDHLSIVSYDEVLERGSAIYDSFILDLEGHDERSYSHDFVSYERLVLPMMLPDRTPIICSAVCMSEVVEIEGGELNNLTKLPPHLQMEKLSLSDAVPEPFIVYQRPNYSS